MVASSQTSEVAHLTKLFRSSTSDRRDATDVIKAMRADESTVFTDEQRVQLSEVVSERITTTQMQDVVGERMHGSNKVQTHL